MKYDEMITNVLNPNDNKLQILFIIATIAMFVILTKVYLLSNTFTS